MTSKAFIQHWVDQGVSRAVAQEAVHRLAAARRYPVAARAEACLVVGRWLFHSIPLRTRQAQMSALLAEKRGSPKPTALKAAA